MMSVLLLVACSFGLETVVDTDRGGAEAETRIDEIDPPSGPPAGDQLVTIEGAGFAGDVVVWFGEKESPEVTVVGPRKLEALTPRVQDEGVVDVTVETDKGSATLEDAYEYTREEAGTGDADTALP